MGKIGIICTCQKNNVIQSVVIVGLEENPFPLKMSRESIVQHIKNNAEVYTIVDGKRGARVILTDDGKYITTVGNSTTRDNLDSLPKCKDC